MRRRPIGPLVDALVKYGVDIRCRDGHLPPVEIHARGLRGGILKISAQKSSQYLSGLLMASPLATAPITICIIDDLVSADYVDITLDIMRAFGVEVMKRGQAYYIEPQPYQLSGDRFFVEGDASSASYFFAAGALPGSKVTIHGISSKSKQPDMKFLDIVRAMGAEVCVNNTKNDYHTDDKTSITVSNLQAKPLRAINVDMNVMPDSALTLAVLALFAEGTTTIRNIAHLRYKESQRLDALYQQLKKTGAQVSLTESSITITPPSKQDMPNSITIETYNDHRIAMAFALLSYAITVDIKNPTCVAKSYPNFFNDFLELTR